MGVFVFKNGKFLMGERKGSHGAGTWTVPGGHLEFGEVIEDGAAREVREETGLEIKNTKVAGITNDIFPEDGKHYITIWLTSHWKKGVPKILEPDKFIQQKWLDFDKLPDNLFLPWRQLKKAPFLKDIKKEAKRLI